MFLLNYNSSFMQFLSKVMKLVGLNLLMLIFGFPLITGGAVITAGHYTALKIRRNEGYVLQNFFKSFKDNFKQSTIIWIGVILNVVVAIVALQITNVMGGVISTFITLFIMVMIILTTFCYMWIFPIQSKFENTILGTVKNSYVSAFKYLGRTVYMILVTVIPIMLLEVLMLNWYIPLFILFGFSVPTYWSAMVYDKVFENLETKTAEGIDENEE